MDVDLFFGNQAIWQDRLATGSLHPQWPNPRLFESHGLRGSVAGTYTHFMLTTDESPAHLDEGRRWALDVGATDALIWGRRPDRDLDVALLADGWRVGFEPWWMVADLTTAPAEVERLTDGIVLRPGTEVDAEALVAAGIPYVQVEQVPVLAALAAHVPVEQGDELVWFVALLDGHLVGHAVANVVRDRAAPPGSPATAGLFNVGVRPDHRRRGIGLALTRAAMRAAREAGATTMGLNSTPMGAGVYARAGFVRVGTGATWMRSSPRWADDPPAAQRELVRAIGAGEVGSIGHPIPERFWCELSAQQLAARFGQPAVVGRLVELGQVPDVVALWRAGLRDEAAAAVGDPAARELITQPWDARPLHHAVEAGHEGLVRLLLEAGADLTATDSQFGGTPLGWAEATGHPELAVLIREAGGR
ncbi:GNAT family N-acetyltransferase [Aestuariimicrobium soli]|uniref:GNAT family N-acetyltransferase n=1 Tax=Aestuariimicrobium soli TaxID=2035834 RepID=UPI003EBF24CF